MVSKAHAQPAMKYLLAYFGHAAKQIRSAELLRQCVYTVFFLLEMHFIEMETLCFDIEKRNYLVRTVE